MTQSRLSHLSVLLIVLVVLSQGLIRLTVVPLWQHYDEPGHYEYLRYTVTHRALPVYTPDPLILDQILATITTEQAVVDDCHEMEAKPDVTCLTAGQQFGEMPGYYLLQALIQWIVNPATVERQVLLARTVSVLISVVTALAAMSTVQTLFPANRLLAFTTPIVMSLIFAYTDLMSALNNDVLAVAAFSLLIAALVAAIRDELSLKSGMMVGVAVGLCMISKSSAWIGLPVAMIGVLIAIWDRTPVWVRIAYLAALILSLILVFEWRPEAGLVVRPLINRRFDFIGGLNSRLRGWYRISQHWGAYWPALRWQFVSFWSAFAAGVPGLPPLAVLPFALLSAAGAGGVVRALPGASRLGSVQRRMLLMIGVAFFASLAMTLLRIDPPDGTGVMGHVPTARYFYVAIVPTVLLLLIGLGSWLRPAHRRGGAVALILFLYAIGVWSLLELQLPWFELHRVTQ